MAKMAFTASHGARMLRESNPQITTVDQHMEMRGKVMADIVIKKIHGIDSPRTVMLPTELVVRSRRDLRRLAAGRRPRAVAGPQDFASGPTSGFTPPT